MVGFFGGGVAVGGGLVGKIFVVVIDIFATHSYDIFLFLLLLFLHH